jgi:Na+/melibiose symporter-like transporter
MYSLAPAFLMVFAAAMMVGYPLTAKRHAAVRAALTVRLEDEGSV